MKNTKKETYWFSLEELQEGLKNVHPQKYKKTKTK